MRQIGLHVPRPSIGSIVIAYVFYMMERLKIKSRLIKDVHVVDVGNGLISFKVT